MHCQLFLDLAGRHRELFSIIPFLPFSHNFFDEDYSSSLPSALVSIHPLTEYEKMEKKNAPFIGPDPLGTLMGRMRMGQSNEQYILVN